MGTELVRACIKEEDIDFPAVPPGFESFMTLKSKVEKTETELSCTVPNFSAQPFHIKIEPKQDDSRTITRSLRCRPNISYGECGNNSDDDSYSQLHDQNIQTKAPLPKGVIRGCSECKDCQKVMARYKPEAACRPNLEEVPVFYPTEKEFEDTLNYIEKIRPKAESYGICRIVPPPSWKPPCHLKEKNIWENSKFATRVQRVDKLQNRDPVRKLSIASNHTRKKRRRCLRMGLESEAGNGNIHEQLELEFGFEPGPQFTLGAFQRYADEFKTHYFGGLDTSINTGVAMSNVPVNLDPPIEIIEGEYWRVVEKPTEEIEVLYGADLETGVFGSGFPKTVDQASSPDEQYAKSGWNLNKLPRLPGSVLTYENPDISGVQVPWLYVGMCFSSFCWHVEDHYLYSLNYMHFGAPKLWYGVPGKDATKLEEAMRKHLPDLFHEQPDLLHKLVTQISPTIVKSEGVPVYRCIQNPGEFVLTFPRAYHAGFNCGFNCAEAVNVAPLDWFPHGQNAVELYSQQGRKTTISHDKLLLGAAMEAVKANCELSFLRKNSTENLRWKNVCGRDGVLAKSLRARVNMERVRRDFLCEPSKVLKMLSNFDATTERECSICFFDLHLSAAACRCSPDRYACLNHAKQLCPCAWSDKFFLFRYDINELDLLVEALEGRLSAVYKWARSYLGFSLSSYNSEDSRQVSDLTSLLMSSQMEDISSKEETLQPVKQVGANVPSRLTLLIRKKHLTPGEKPSTPVATVKDTKVTSDGVVLTGNKFRIKKEVCKPSTSNVITTDIQQPSGKTVVNKSSFEQNVICLSDDEGELLDEPLSGYVKQTALPRPFPDKKSELSNNDLAADARPADQNCTNLSSSGKRGVPWSASVAAQPIANQTNLSCHQASNGARIDGGVQGLSNSKSIAKSVVLALGVQQIKKSKDETPIQKIDPRVADDVSILPGNPSCSQSSLDKCHRQKGPRVAKVVRRMNCNVEPLELGAIVSGKLWNNSRAIFPKGFRSRVRYINILDPTNMCHYISEVLDWGPKGPLFMVYLEHCPNEVFVHLTPTRCWEMVLERVNQEITKQHKLGKQKLPPLQPPCSLDGFEMFGFTSPAIIQAIEALDRNRVCRNYWNGRTIAHVSQHFKSEDSGTPGPKSDNTNSAEADRILRGLFKKANSEELHSLLGVWGENKPATDCSFLTRLLEEEIHKRFR